MRLIERISENATLEGFIWRDRIEYFPRCSRWWWRCVSQECVPSIWIRRSTLFAALVAIVYGAVILFTEPIVFAGLVGWYQGRDGAGVVISIIEGFS